MFAELYPSNPHSMINPSSYASCHILSARMRILCRYNLRVHYRRVKTPSVRTLNFAATPLRIHNRNWTLLGVSSNRPLTIWPAWLQNLYAPHYCNLHNTKITSFHLLGTHRSTADHDFYSFGHIVMLSVKIKLFKLLYIIAIAEWNLFYYFINYCNTT